MDQVLNWPLAMTKSHIRCHYIYTQQMQAEHKQLQTALCCIKFSGQGVVSDIMMKHNE